MVVISVILTSPFLRTVVVIVTSLGLKANFYLFVLRYTVLGNVCCAVVLTVPSLAVILHQAVSIQYMAVPACS